MADEEDDGWGSPVNPGWSAPPPAQPPYAPPGSGPNPTAPLPIPPAAPGAGGPPPNYPPAYGAPAAPGPGGRPPGSSGRGLSGRTLAIIVVAVIVVAGGIVGAVVAASGGSKHHSASPTTPVNSPSTSSSTSPSAPSTAPSTSPSSPATSSSVSTPSDGGSLLSIAPFTGCQAGTPDKLADVTATAAIACEGTDVQAQKADAVLYERFATTADLSTFYGNDILTKNGVARNTGNCSTGQLATTTNKAEYCEGAFTDDTGAAARQFLIVAPISVDLSIGTATVSEACTGASSYTMLIFTSPSDDVIGGVLSCTGAAATAQAFEQEMRSGNFDLND